MTDQEMKDWIDNANYESLLSKWRFAPSGDPFFQGVVGKHYSKAIADKRDEDHGEAVRASKQLGW